MMENCILVSACGGQACVYACEGGIILGAGVLRDEAESDGYVVCFRREGLDDFCLLAGPIG